jgi:FGGY-family pentulose kinase
MQATSSTSAVTVGVDVGTGSVRAGVFTLDGRLHGLGISPIPLWRLPPDLAEQSSVRIWEAVALAVREAVTQAGTTSSDVIGLGFDATCSLVALDAAERPLTVSPTGSQERNIIVWMDHRASQQAKRINASAHSVLRYVGGGFSPEQQPPKLLWLKENMPDTYRRAARFMDLADFLTYHASGRDTRSLCTTVCKWSYLGHENRWDETFFRAADLADLGDGRRIGTTVAPPGTPLGPLLPQRAAELGLSSNTLVAVGIIDAHAGALGVLGMGERDLDLSVLETSLALIVGTSSCHLAIAPAPRFIAGVWGPYYGALLPGFWLNEGGQSATGALLDHVIASHPASDEISRRATAERQTPHALLSRELECLSGGPPPDPTLTSHLHVLPYFLGNRSPRADADALGAVCGLRIDQSVQDLAQVYYASIQALAYGTRHILEAFNDAGYRISRLKACGGGTKNTLWLQEHADVTGCEIVLPQEGEAVVLGAAMLGAVAAGSYPDLRAACVAMGRAGDHVRPRADTAPYHERKYRVYHRMYEDQKEYGALMKDHTAPADRNEEACGT